MDDSRIPDPFYTSLITMYRRRADMWRKVSMALLGVTFLFVIAGIFIFYRGDKRTMAAEREVELKTELRIVRDDIRNLLSSVDETQADLAVANEADVLAQQFVQFNKSVLDILKEADLADEAIQKAKFTQLQELEVVVDRVAIIVRNTLNVLNKADEASVHQVPMGDKGMVAYSQEAYRQLSSTSVKIDWSAASKEIEDLNAQLQKVSPKTVAEDLKQVQSVAAQCTRNHAASSQLNLLGSSTAQNRKRINDELQTAHRDFATRQANVSKLQSREESLNKELESIVGDRNYVLFMAWIPDLTVRVGAVILLLFITKILLVTYRYTASLSSYYLGIADAIQLLQPASGQAGWYKIEHLTALLAHLIPSGLTMETINTPADNLSDLAKAWIAKKAP